MIPTFLLSKTLPARRQRGGIVGALLGLLLVIALAAGSAVAWWLSQPLNLRSPSVELAIESGASPREIAQNWVAAGVETSPVLLYEWFRWSGQSRQIRAGSYVVEPGTTPRSLLRMMVRGDERLAVVKLIDGWTFKRFRAELAQADGLRPGTATLSDEQLMAELGSPGVSPEGQFFPDTYSYAKGSTDLAVLQRAHRALQKHLNEAWTLRSNTCPLRSPQDVLTLASIVEKETGREADRSMIAAVFCNRLRIGLPLQTEPKVIYGLGQQFTGQPRRCRSAVGGPRAALVPGADGALYGTASAGGAGQRGALFKITLAGVFTPLAQFTNVGGWSPAGGVTVAGGLRFGAACAVTVTDVNERPFGGMDGKIFIGSKGGDGEWTMETAEVTNMAGKKPYVLAFAQDNAGEVYVLTSITTGPNGSLDTIYKIVP